MTMSMNEWRAIGNLTRDAELKHIPSGEAVLEFSIAVNERYQDKGGNWKDSDPVFMECQIWGKPAEKAAPTLQKGVQVFVSGKLQLDQWEDKESGQKRSKFRCRVFNHGVFQKFASEESSGQGGGRREPAQQGSGGRSSAPSKGFGDDLAGF